MLALIACVAGVAVAVSYAGTRSGPVVTVIGDSVADGMEHNPVALNRLNRDFTLNLQTQGCRRLATQSCTIVGEPAPPANVVTLAKRLGPRLGRIVVVATGYNDDPYRFDRDLRKVMRTLDAEGVKRVVWLTLREAKSVYAVSNADIEEESGKWPTLTVADGTATAPVVLTGSRPTASTSPSLAPRRSPCSFNALFAAPRKSLLTEAPRG